MSLCPSVRQAFRLQTPLGDLWAAEGSTVTAAKLAVNARDTFVKTDCRCCHNPLGRENSSVYRDLPPLCGFPDP